MRKYFVLLTVFSSLTFFLNAQNKEKGHDYVDLGLSVKWATCNVGASTPEDYGNFYAWGETQTKQSFTAKNYAFRTGGSWAADIRLSKYNTNPEKGPVDGKVRLVPSDDAASVNWGGRWRMPTKDEVEELFSRCRWVKSEINGVPGFRVTGPNGNSIFIPATGLMSENKIIGQGERACIWTSSLITNDAYPCAAASCLIVYNSKNRQNDMDRAIGMMVRPVFKSN